MKTITSVTISDVEKRRLPSKHYVYVIFVRWSDGGQYVIYRRYSRFFDLQSTLLDKFPIEAGTIDPTQRILPILPGKILFGRSHVREVAVKRLKPIEAYCKSLIVLPASISHCEDVLDFFEVEDDDLEPPSDKLSKIVESKAEKITKPKELKRLVAAQDYMKQDRGEIDLRAGQVVELVEQSQSGWWFVNAEDEQGWVPSTFLQSMEDEVDENIKTVSLNAGEWYVCVEDYEAGSEDELSLHKGDVLQVLETNMHGWWRVRCHGVEGLAPATYLTKAHDRQAMNVAEKGRASGVEIISSLSQISDLFNKETPQEHEQGEAPNSGVVFGAKRHKSGLGVGPESSGAGVADLYSIVNKTKSLERGGSLRPPPRQNSVEKAAVKIGAKNPASRYLTRAEFYDAVGDGISFKANQEVHVLERAAGGWWYVQIGDQEGWAPTSYIYPAPQVEEKTNHQLESKESTVSTNPLSANTSKPLAGGSCTKPMLAGKKNIMLKQTPKPKELSLNDENKNFKTENDCEVKGITKKRCISSPCEAGAAPVHRAPAGRESGVVVTLLPSVSTQTAAHTPHSLAKPKPPLKPNLPKPTAKRYAPNLTTKPHTKENISSLFKEPNMQGITASLRAKFEKREPDGKLSTTCPPSNQGKSVSGRPYSLAGKFTSSENIATKPKLPVKPIDKPNGKTKPNKAIQNEKSPLGVCESVNVNALVNSLGGQLRLCDQQSCIPSDKRTQWDRQLVSPGVDARAQDLLRTQALVNDSASDCGSSGSMYTSVCGFTAEQDGEVGFAEGERVRVLEMLDGGWWRVSLSDGREGWAPSAFLSQS